MVPWLHCFWNMSTTFSLSPRWQGKSLSVWLVLENHERTVSSVIRAVLKWFETDDYGDDETRCRLVIWYCVNLWTMRNFQESKPKQTLDRHLLNNGRHHWKAKFAGIRDPFLQRLEAKEDQSDLLCSLVRRRSNC